MRIKALALVLPMATLFLALSGIASAASFTVLHSFSGPDGETPAAPLIQGADGFFYGSRPTEATSRFCPPTAAARSSARTRAAPSRRSTPSRDPKALGPRA